MRRPGTRTGAVFATVGALVCLAIAGCGGSSPSQRAAGAGSTSAQSQKYVDALKFSRCMRANGVSNFPDPQNPGGWPASGIDALNTAAPAFSTATSKCDRLLPNSGQPTSAVFEQAVVNGVKIAKCFRAHGIYFPDPGIQGDQLTLNMANTPPITPRWKQVGAICTKKVFGYVAADT